MAEKIYMTALSPTMENGTISEWLKKEGDRVKNGEVLCEVETDKAAMEYEADFDAFLLKIIVNEGESAGVGDVIAFYGEEGEEVDADEASAAEADGNSASGEKASAAPAAAAENKEEFPDKNESAAPDSTGGTGGTGGKRIKASPLARNMASKLSIDLSSIEGSGYGGRIIKKDILDAGGSVQEEAVSGRSSMKGVSSMRKTIAKRLVESKFSAPHFYLTLSADMSGLQQAREDYYKRTGVKPSFNSYLIKLAASALIKNPVVNSSWADEQIQQFEKADIGFAVALKEGLITPVIRGCEHKGIAEIDKEFRSLAEAAKGGGLSPQQYTGAGFTISNLGGFGIEEFTAIINPPGSAILAVGAIIKTPVVVTADGEDSVAVKPIMKMTLSCDHRVIDGAVGAAFMADLKRMIENPVEALM